MASEAPSSEKVAFEQGRKSFNLRVGTIYSDALASLFLLKLTNLDFSYRFFLTVFLNMEPKANGFVKHARILKANIASA